MEALADASERWRDHDVTPAAQLIRGVPITPAPMPCSMYKDKVGHHILRIAPRYFWTSLLLLASVTSTPAKPGTSPASHRGLGKRDMACSSPVQPTSLFARRVRTKARSVDMNRASIDGMSLTGSTCCPCSCAKTSA